MAIIKRVLCFIVGTLLIFTTPAGGQGCVVDNIGKTFIIGFQDVSRDNNPRGLVTLGSTTVAITEVSMTSPARDPTILEEQVEVEPLDYSSINVPSTLLALGGTGDNGVLVESSQDIVLLGTLREDARRGRSSFLALPVEGLGTEYYAIGTHPLNDLSQVTIVAIEDVTELTVTLATRSGVFVSVDGRQYTSGEQISVELSAHQTFTMQSSVDLTGSRILANKPVAVYSGGRDEYVGDNEAQTSVMTSQLLPVDAWGTNFNLAPLAQREGTYIRYVAAEAGTTVVIRVDDGTIIYTWTSQSQGDSQSTTTSLPGLSMSVSASAPIQLLAFYESSSLQPATEGNHPAQLLVPPVEQYLNSFTFPVLGGNLIHYATFVIRSDDIQGLLLDGTQVDTDEWSRVTSDADRWMTKTLPTSRGMHVVSHVDGDVRYMVTVFLSSQQDGGVAYPAGMCLDKTDLRCDKKYLTIEDHSACLPTSDNVFTSGVSENDKNLIIAIHNSNRSRVNPAASNMLLMSWDDELAMGAQGWANSCPETFHEEGQKRRIPGRFSSVGQNSAWGQDTWLEVIALWVNEVQDFTYGEAPEDGVSVGHYTQVVWDDTSRVGCGFAFCDEGVQGIRPIYICNYGPAGNIDSSARPSARYEPYELGVSCAACPNKCEFNQCDCGGLVCYNGGSLNLETCTCTCLENHHIQPDCTLNCTAALDNAFLCGFMFSQDDCNDNANAVDNCPWMCKVCPYGGIGGDVAPPSTVPTVPQTATTATTPVPQACDCGSVFVSGPSEQKDRVGIYKAQQCDRDERIVYLHNDGQSYLFYDRITDLWYIAPTMSTAGAFIRSTETAAYPYDVPSVWTIFSTNTQTWQLAPSLRVECMCKDVVCSRLDIESDSVANTFPGTFQYVSMFNQRPYYRNTDQDVFMYFNTGTGCNYWAVGPQMASDILLMHAYDISAHPYLVRATWRVSSGGAWGEDESLRVVCLD